MKINSPPGLLNKQHVSRVALQPDCIVGEPGGDVSTGAIMAGDWIKMRHALMSDPKVMAIGRHLVNTSGFNVWLSGDQLSGNECYISDNALRYCVTGALHNAWCNANEHAENDVIKNADLQWLDCITGIPKFGEAMQKVGWASVKDGSLILPKFNSNNTSGAERQKKYRERKRNGSDVTRDVTSDAKRREEKRREDILDNTNKNIKQKRKTSEPYSEIFLEFWKVFPAQRRQKKPEAFRAWQKAMQAGADPVEIIQGASEYASSYLATKERGKFCMGPEPFLNGHRWEDDRESWKEPKKPSRVVDIANLTHYDPYANPDDL